MVLDFLSTADFHIVCRGRFSLDLQASVAQFNTGISGPELRSGLFTFSSSGAFDLVSEAVLNLLKILQLALRECVF